jgi:hypothetical protein
MIAVVILDSKEPGEGRRKAKGAVLDNYLDGVEV